MKRPMTVLIVGVLGLCVVPTAALAVGDHEGQFCWTGFQYDCHKPCVDSQGQIGVGPFTGTWYSSWKVTANGVFIKLCKPSSNPHQHCCTRNVKCGDIYYYAATGCPPNHLIWIHEDGCCGNTCWKNTINEPCPPTTDECSPIKC